MDSHDCIFLIEDELNVPYVDKIIARLPGERDKLQPLRELLPSVEKAFLAQLIYACCDEGNKWKGGRFYVIKRDQYWWLWNYQESKLDMGPYEMEEKTSSEGHQLLIFTGFPPDFD